MAAVIEAIKGRRSVRVYDPERDVSEETVRTLLECAMAAPSACNEQPWHYVVVRDAAVRAQMPAVNPYAKMALDAPVVVVVCGDPSLENPMAKGMWVQDCSAAIENLLVAAHALGLGAVWTGIHPIADRVQGLRTLLGIPETVVPLALIPVGYPKQPSQPASRFNQGRVHIGTW